MKKNRWSWKSAVRHAETCFLVGVLVLWTLPALAAETGTIQGRLVDERDRVTFAGKAAVFLCDAQTGLPIVQSTKKLLDLSQRLEKVDDFWHVVTTDEGDFKFQEVPVGKYRLIAQSWSGTEGVPDFQRKPSTVVVLHGVAENVEVKPGELVEVYPRKLGDGVLKIINDPEEAHAFLLISLKPRLGEGVLGPPAWGPEFLSGLIGATQMETGYVTLVGLPEGKEIHVGLFNYDNNPGVGGDSYVVGKEKEVRLNIYATWSNGKYDPPMRLLKLTEHFEQQNSSVSERLGLPGRDRDNQQAILKMLREKADQKIEVQGVGTFTVADVLAASMFQKLRKSHRERNRR